MASTYTVPLRGNEKEILLPLPQAVAHELKLSWQDVAEVTLTENGFVVRFENTIFERGMEAAERVNQRYASAMRALADS